MVVSTVETNPPDFDDWRALHRLLAESFAEMEGRIDPPSSMARLGVEQLAAKARAEDLFLIRDQTRPLACLFGKLTGRSYYIGKLSAAVQHRRRGFARALITAAAHHGQALGASALELESRVELVENHATFAALGFQQVGATTHPGYDRPTSLTFRRPIPFP